MDCAAALDVGAVCDVLGSTTVFVGGVRSARPLSSSNGDVLTELPLLTTLPSLKLESGVECGEDGAPAWRLFWRVPLAGLDLTRGPSTVSAAGDVASDVEVGSVFGNVVVKDVTLYGESGEVASSSNGMVTFA
jgi:hypothetical protein